MKRIVTLSLVALMAVGLTVLAFAAPTGVGNHPTVYPVSATPLSASPTGVTYVAPYMWVSMADIDPNEDDVLIVNTAIIGNTSADGTIRPANDKATSTSGGGTAYSAIQPGWTAYYPLRNRVNAVGADLSLNPYDGINTAEAVKSARVTVKHLHDDSQGVFDSAKIVYKKAASGSLTEYSYFLAIATKEFAGTGGRNFAAEVSLKKTSGVDGSNNSYAFDLTYNIGFRVQRDVVNSIYKNAYRISPSDTITNDPNGEATYDFLNTDLYYEANMFAQGGIVIAMNMVFDKEVIALYPEADMNFYNGTGTFNKVGTLVIPAAPGSFLYGRDEDGKLIEIDFEYDDGEEAFRVPTRVLGSYVVSDIELDLSLQAVAEEPVIDAPMPDDAPVLDGEFPATVKPVPDTGAAA